MKLHGFVELGISPAFSLHVVIKATINHSRPRISWRNQTAEGLVVRSCSSRLFPLREDVRWTYRVHEQILPALRRAKIPVSWTGITVRHTGYSDTITRARKLDRDLRLCHLDLRDQPDEPFILFNIGAISVERCEWDVALGYLRRSLERSAPTDSITRKLFALIARVHQMTGGSGEALRTCRAGLKLDPEDAELWFRKAVVHRYRGESNEDQGRWQRS